MKRLPFFRVEAKGPGGSFQRIYSRDKHFWYVSSGDETLYIGLVGTPNEYTKGDFIAAYKDWVSVEDCN